MEQTATQHRALKRIEQALLLISTGMVHRDGQIRAAILSELAGGTGPGELRRRPADALNRIAETVLELGERLKDGIVYDTLLDLQLETRRLYDKLAMERPRPSAATRRTHGSAASRLDQQEIVSPRATVKETAARRLPII